MTGLETRAAPLERERRVRAVQAPAGIRTVTVVIPCYNYARFLPGAVESALTQRDVAVDVVIVEDAGQDDAAEVARALAARDPRVTALANPVNLGPVGTFNRGLAHAHGEYLVRLDADDLLTPGSLARAVALAEAHPGVGLVYGRPVHFHGEPPAAHRDTARSWHLMPGGAWLDRRCARGVNCITSPEVLMRRSVVDRVGGQRALAHSHDMEMWMRIARSSDVGIVLGADQAFHRDHDASLSAREVDVRVDLDQRLAAFETLLADGLGDPVVDARRLATARAALGGEALGRTVAACARGRGGSGETASYLAFAQRCGELDALPHARLARAALRRGARARTSPDLLAWAAANRLRAIAHAARWRRTGL